MKLQCYECRFQRECAGKFAVQLALILTLRWKVTRMASTKAGSFDHSASIPFG